LLGRGGLSGCPLALKFGAKTAPAPEKRRRIGDYIEQRQIITLKITQKIQMGKPPSVFELSSAHFVSKINPMVVCVIAKSFGLNQQIVLLTHVLFLRIFLAGLLSYCYLSTFLPVEEADCWVLPTQK
jgi:hypothetical protein